MAETVVIYRLGSLGDTVVALPCLHGVAAAFPAARRIALTNFPVSSNAAPLQAILGGSGLVDQFVAYPINTRSVRTLVDLFRKLRALHADTLIYLTPSRGLLRAWRDVLFFRLCGFTRIIGAPVTGDLQRNRRGADGQVESECARLARCVASLGTVAIDDTAAWSLHLSDTEHRAAAAVLDHVRGRPRIAINMGGKVVQNDWGESNWCALATVLRKTHGDHVLVFIGAKEDSARSARVGDLWPGPTINLCGVVPPRVSAAAMAGSKLFIGHDSGPLHLAASVDVTCVGLFGDKNEPRKWHPYLGRHRIIHDMLGMAHIRVEQVAKEVVTLLGPPTTSPSHLHVGEDLQR